MNDEKNHPATITAATVKHFEDTGNVILGTLEVVVGDRLETVRFRVDETRAVVKRILFEAAGLASDAEPEQLIGRHVRVVLGGWTSQSGVTRTVVRKWLPAEPKPRAPKPAAPAAKAAPAWERDEAQKRPPRTPAARVRASIERAGGEEDDGIPF
jgi:hypothetical protein